MAVFVSVWTIQCLTWQNEMNSQRIPNEQIVTDFWQIFQQLNE